MKSRAWLAALAPLVAIILLTAACGHRSEPPSAAAATRSVAVAPVASTALADGVHAVGLLTPKDEARLAFKVGGVIESMRVEEGTRVRAGQLLAVLKQAEIGAAVEQARQASAKAERDLKRGQALYADGVAAEEQLQDLTTAARVAAAGLASAEFNASYARITAPANGVVLRKFAEANELVQAGQPVLIVGGDGRGWVVRVGLADKDAVRVHVGDAARVSFDAWPGLGFDGRVSNLASSADPATGTFTVEIAVREAGVSFVQGLVAKVVVVPRAARVSRVLPVQALIEANGDEASVFVLRPGHDSVQRVAIRIGRLAEGQVEVLGGLAPDALVVIDGGAFLEDGERVRIASGPEATKPPAG